MQRYIAFLRGINVGGHRVRMDALRTLFEAQGLAEVETFIASGNVIFRAPDADREALEHRIESHLRRELGYGVDTFLRTPAELGAIVAGEPFGASGPAGPDDTLMVVFLKSAPAAVVGERLRELQSETDAFHVEGREVYWLTRGRMSDSPAAVPLGKIVGPAGTMRNMTTVRKLAAKYPAV